MDPYDESLPSHSVFVRHVDGSTNKIQKDELTDNISTKNKDIQRQSIERFSIDENLKTKISSTPPRTSSSKIRKSLDRSSDDDIRSPPPPPPLSLSMENLNLRSKFQDKIDNDNKLKHQFSNTLSSSSQLNDSKSNKNISPKPFLKKGSRKEPSALNRINSPTLSSKSSTSQQSSQNNSPVNFNSSTSNNNSSNNSYKINNGMHNHNFRNSFGDFADNEIDVGFEHSIREDIYNNKDINIGKVRNSNEDILLSGRDYFNPNQSSNILSPNKFNGYNSLSSTNRSDRTEDMGEMSILIQTNRANSIKELDEFALLEAEAEEITSNVHIRSSINTTYPNSTEKNDSISNNFRSNISGDNKTSGGNTRRSSPLKLSSPSKLDNKDGINDKHWTQQHRNKGSSYSSRLGDSYDGNDDDDGNDGNDDDDIYNVNDKIKSNAVGYNQTISPTNTTRPKLLPLPTVNDNDDYDDDEDISNIATNGRLNDVSRSWGAVTKPEINHSYDEENNSDDNNDNRQEKSQYKSFSNEYQVYNEDDYDDNDDKRNYSDNYDNRDEYFDNLLKIKSDHIQNTNKNNRTFNRSQNSYAENNTGINMNNIIHSRPVSANSVKKNNIPHRKSYNSDNTSRNQEKNKEMKNNDIIYENLQIKAKELETEINTYKKENLNLKQLRKQQESALSEVLNQRNETIKWISEEKNKTIAWCNEQKSLANKERRSAAKLARDSRQRANSGGVGNVSIRKEKQEIDGLSATIEKMKIDNELSTKKFRMTERRLNQLIKDQSININELNSNVNSLEKDKIELWTFLENSGIRISNNILKMRPKATGNNEKPIHKNNYRGDSSYGEEVEVNDDLNFVSTDYVDTISSHNDTNIRNIKSKYNYLDKKTSNIVYPKVRADNSDTIDEQINSPNYQFNLNSSNKKHNLRISNSSSLKSSDSNEILLQQIISKESKLKKLVNLENNLCDSWNRSSRSSRSSRYSHDENGEEDDEFYYNQNNENNNKSIDVADNMEEIVQFGTLTESDNKISNSTLKLNTMTSNSINNFQTINKITETNNFSPNKFLESSPSKIAGFPIPSYFPNHKPSSGHVTSSDYISGSDSMHNSQSFNQQLTSNIDDVNSLSSPLTSPLSTAKVVKDTKVVNNGRIEETLADGTKIIKYLNGTTKEAKLDGSSLVKFSNGDTKHSFIDGMIIYYYSQAKTTHTTYKDGLQTFLFPNEQVDTFFFFNFY
jgi:hypothetical protein